jgi:hypothetical protein
MHSSTDNPATAAERWWCLRRIVVTVERPDGSRDEVLVAKPFARIGRDERSEVALTDAAVLPCHVYLHATSDGVYCAGLAPGSLSGWLLPATNLDVGPFRIRAALADGQSSRRSPADPQAKGSAGPRVPRIRMFTDKARSSHADFLLQRQLTFIGRQAPATWRIKHPAISRIHGAAVWDGAELWLIDFFSSNGTRLGEQRCDAALIPLGQEFRISTVVCSYVDIQPAAAARLTGQQPVVIATAEDAAADRDATHPSTKSFTPEHRIDAPQSESEPVAPPHASPLGSGSKVLHRPATATPPLEGPGDSSATHEAAPVAAAMIETRPLAVDTKIVERPPRLLEDRLAAVEAELAAYRDRSATRASRVDAELAGARQELNRMELALREERESLREQRAEVTEWRERAEREIAQLRQQLADVDGMTIAKIAELRARLDLPAIERQSAATSSNRPGVVEAIAWQPRQECGESADASVRDVTIDVGGPSDSDVRTEGPVWRQSEESTEGALSLSPAGSSTGEKKSTQARFSEEFTDRLIDLHAKREESAWKRRLLWTVGAVLLVVAIVVAAVLARIWLNQQDAARSSTGVHGPAAGLIGQHSRRLVGTRSALLCSWTAE